MQLTKSNAYALQQFGWARGIGVGVAIRNWHSLNFRFTSTAGY